VLDDLEGEEETIPALEEGDVTIPALEEGDVTKLVLSTVNDVSRGVSDGTHEEYQR
jgi:hypothetical protein